MVKDEGKQDEAAQFAQLQFKGQEKDLDQLKMQDLLKD